MSCEYCRNTFGHDPRCPYAPPPMAIERCKFCKEGIYNGEEYIENEKGEFAHWECIEGAYDLSKFLGTEIKTMEKK